MTYPTMEMYEALHTEKAELYAEIERLKAAATKATKTWRKESSSNSIKIYKAMEALERALESKP